MMNPDEKDLDYFISKFNELADDAQQNGLSVAILIENADPIAREAGYKVIYRGTPATLAGLLHMALSDF